MGIMLFAMAALMGCRPDVPDEVEDKDDDPGAAACFAGETPIDTPRGPVPISSLRPGDLVVSYDLDARRTVARPIAHVITHNDRVTWTLHAAGARIVGVTAGHPFYEVRGREWVEAGDLAPGQSLAVRGPAGLHRSPFRSLERRPGLHTVYDLTVDGAEHNFFAGGVLVHNKSPTPTDTAVEPKPNPMGWMSVAGEFLYDPAIGRAELVTISGLESPPNMAVLFSAHEQPTELSKALTTCGAVYALDEVSAPFVAETEWWFGVEGVGELLDVTCDDEVRDDLATDTWQLGIGGDPDPDFVEAAVHPAYQDKAIGAVVIADHMGGQTPAIAFAFEVDEQGVATLVDDLLVSMDPAEVQAGQRAYFRFYSMSREQAVDPE